MAHTDFNASEISLTEGKAITWFTREAAQQLAMAHNDGAIVEAYYS